MRKNRGKGREDLASELEAEGILALFSVYTVSGGGEVLHQLRYIFIAMGYV